MAMSGMKSSGGGVSHRSVPTTLAEINVTPLVDVMLVLLIVFMVSAPLMQQGIQVDLPKANTGTMNEIPDQLVLVVNHKQEISIAENLVPKGTLLQKLSAIASAKPRIQVVIQADQSLHYGFIAQVMAEVKKAGIQRVGLVTEPGQSNSRL